VPPRAAAGVLVFRRGAEGLELLLAHPGGPLWARKDLGAWTIFKGEPGAGEEPLACARRELLEESGLAPDGPFLDLGEIRQKGGKLVHAWAVEADADPDALASNDFTMEWPPRSGRSASFPELDRYAWLAPEEARRRINPAQAELIDRLRALLG
jgi:predicted NUDIX family NTP pyrophosphohydrolase